MSNLKTAILVGAGIIASSLFLILLTRNVNRHCCMKKSSPIEMPVGRNKNISPERKNMMQVTFAMIKPDAVEAHNSGKIIDLIEKNGFEILRMEKIMFSKELAEEFYAVHKERPFFGELVEFITSGPVIVMALEKENAVQAWRDLMGATNPANAAEGTVRKLYAQSIGKNAAHGSDSPENANIELELIFPNPNAGGCC